MARESDMMEIDKITFLPSFSITEGAFFLNLRNRVGPLGAAAVLKKRRNINKKY